MKYILIPVISLILVLGSSCDKIEGPYKDVNPNGGQDTSSSLRKILVEDYTGHTCGNCPKAAETAASLEGLYPSQVLVMSVHAGWFSIPTPPNPLPSGAPAGSYSYDFRNPAAKAIDDFFGVSNIGNPNGMVNRKEQGSLIMGQSAWSSAVQTFVGQKAAVRIALSTDYSSATRTGSVSVESKFTEAVVDEYKLIVYLLEDSIVNWQKDDRKSPSHLSNYIHRHVLRSAVNGNWGEVVAIPSTQTGSSIISNYSYTLGGDWKDSQVSLLAIVYREDTKEILQAETIKIRKS
jgi:hypothetical protein